MKEFIESLRKRNEYSYICNYGQQMSKSELCDIIKEFIYQMGFETGDAAEDYDSIADSLADLYEEE